MKTLTNLGLLLMAVCSFASDQEGRMSLFVVGCFTPEFQDIFDGDLDGYLLIGDDGDIDGSYLPRNYDNEVPNQNCDLPIRRSKDGDYNVIKGTFVECQFLVDNSSTVGGGPFDAPATTVTINFPAGLTPVASSNPVSVSGQTLTCDLGTLREDGMKGVSVRFLATMTGDFQLSGTVTSSLFDPDTSNNTSSQAFQVVEPGSHLVYPWISKNPQFESDIVVNNYGSDKALVWFSAVRAEGAFHTRAVVIPARGFVRDTTEHLFPEIGEGSGYSIRVLSDSSQVSGGWVTNNLFAASGRSPSQGVAINMLDPSLAKDRAGSSILFGYLPISANLVSAPVVVNMGAEAADVQLDFYDAMGQLVFSDQQTLAAQAPFRPFATVANNLVPAGSGDLQMVATSETSILTGVSFVFNTSAEPAIGNVSGIEDNPGGTRLVYPWISNNAQFESIIVMNNLGDTEAQVQLTGRRASGSPEVVPCSIPARGFYAEQASNLFPSLGSGPGYTVELTSNNSQIEGRWVTNNLTTSSGSSPSQGVGILLDRPDSPDMGNDLLFGYLPLTAGFTSAPVIVNVGDAATNVTMRFYDEQGQLVIQDSSTLIGIEPFRPFASVANNLVPTDSGDLYMVASSPDQPLTGVVFVFNEGAEPAIGNATAIDFNP